MDRAESDKNGAKIILVPDGVVPAHTIVFLSRVDDTPCSYTAYSSTGFFIDPVFGNIIVKVGDRTARSEGGMCMLTNPGEVSIHLGVSDNACIVMLPLDRQLSKSPIDLVRAKFNKGARSLEYLHEVGQTLAYFKKLILGDSSPRSYIFKADAAPRLVHLLSGKGTVSFNVDSSEEQPLPYQAPHTLMLPANCSVCVTVRTGMKYETDIVALSPMLPRQ